MKKKSIIIGSIIIFIILIMVCLYTVLSKQYSNEGIMNKTNKVTITVTDKENKEIYNSVINTQKKYLADALEELDDLNVKMEDSEYGKYITSILGIEQENNYYWSYYRNGEYGNLGVSSCEIEDNMIYSFKIERFEY